MKENMLIQQFLKIFVSDSPQLVGSPPHKIPMQQSGNLTTNSNNNNFNDDSNKSRGYFETSYITLEIIKV